MFREGNKYFTSVFGTDKTVTYENEELLEIINKKYNKIEAAFFPDKYEVGFILEEENVNNSFEDKWKIIFYKKTMKLPEFGSGTITLDNLDSLQDSGYTYDIYKEIDGSFEDVIKVSCDLISKHRENLSNE